MSEKQIDESKRFLDTTPTLLEKAQKNEVEEARFREALIRDSAALTDFLAYLDQQVEAWN